MDSAFGIFLEATLLHVVLVGLVALIFVLWAFNKFLDARDRAEWGKVREEGKIPIKPKFARRGGSTGKMQPLAAVLEAAAENRKRFNTHYKDYEDASLEEFARRVQWVLALLHPDLQHEWVSRHAPEELMEAADFVEGLGFEDISKKLREFAPYQHAAHLYSERDLDVPDDAPESVRFFSDLKWLEEHRAWERVISKAHEVLEHEYPWDQDHRENASPSSTHAV